MEFLVVQKNLQPIIGRYSSEEMGAINVDYEQVDAVESGPTEGNGAVARASKVEQIARRFPKVFDGGLGRFPGEVRLTLRTDAVPSCNVSCAVPPHLRERLRSKLEELVSRNVIERVELPTEWVNRLSMQIKKNGNLRICLDPRRLNEGLIREVFHTPNLDEVLPNLSNV